MGELKEEILSSSLNASVRAGGG